MGSLSKILSAPTARIEKCGFRDWRNTLDDEDREALDKALADDTLSHTMLAQRLIQAGCPVGRERITDHRRGTCKSCR